MLLYISNSALVYDYTKKLHAFAVMFFSCDLVRLNQFSLLPYFDFNKMHITVKSFANIKDVLGGPEVAAELSEGSTLSGLIDGLSRKFGALFDRQVRDQSTGELVPFLILINNRTCRSTTDMDEPVQDGDVVTIMIPFDGG